MTVGSSGKAGLRAGAERLVAPLWLSGLCAAESPEAHRPTGFHGTGIDDAFISSRMNDLINSSPILP